MNILDSITPSLKKSQLAARVYKAFRCALTSISPTLNTIVTFRISKGRQLNLCHPASFDEKISWLKLNVYNHDALVRECADKLAVRKYVERQGCGDLLNELYAVYDCVEDIPWASLPPQFVLKWNVGSGGHVICPELETLDIEAAKRFLRRAGRRRYHLPNAELQYKDIHRVILCEKYISTQNGRPPADYKFDCYSGQVRFVMVCTDRGLPTARYYRFDRDWNRISGEASSDGVAYEGVRPAALEEAVRYAEILSAPFPYVRVDFYIEEGRVIFGELTFTPTGGIDSGIAEELDALLGKPLVLPALGG